MQCFACRFKLFKQACVDRTLAGIGCDQVPEVTDLGLPNSVNTSEPLLYLVGVPWKVVVNHQMSALKVNTLAGGIIGNENNHLAVLHKPGNNFPPLFPRNATVYNLNTLGFAQPATDFVSQIQQSVFGFGEDDELPPIAFSVCHQFVIEYLVQLQPLAVIARPQNPESLRFKPLEGLHLNLKFLNSLSCRDSRRDPLFNRLHLVFSVFVDFFENIFTDQVNWRTRFRTVFNLKARLFKLELKTFATTL